MANAQPGSDFKRMAATVERKILAMDCSDTAAKRKAIREYSSLATANRQDTEVVKADLFLGDFYLDCIDDRVAALLQYEKCIAAVAQENKYRINALVGAAQASDNNVKALNYYRQALALEPDAVSAAGIYGNMGALYNALGDYPHALSSYEKTYTLYDRQVVAAGKQTRQDTLELMLLLINIANVHIALLQHDKAMDNFRQVQQLNDVIDNPRFGMYSLEGMGNCMHLKDDLPAALRYYTGALDKSRELGDLLEQCSILNNIGNIHLQQHELAAAAASAQHALVIATLPGKGNADHAGNLPGTYSLLSKIAFAGNNLPQARTYAQTAITLYQKAQNMDGESDEWLELSRIYERGKNSSDALAAYKRHIALRDSVFSQEKAQELTRIELNADFRRRQLADSLVQARKDQQATAQLQKQRREKYFFFLGSILLLVIAIGAVYFSVYARRSKRKIELLMKEMHHRVKNNLQVIGTLLHLQLADVLDETARRSIEESITRISSIALIHHHLYRVNDLASIELADFVRELLSQVSSIYSMPGQQLDTDLDIPSTILDIDTAIPLGLILNELMTNSFKYAYAGKDTCRMTLELESIPGSYRITYRDYGPGLPESFDIEEADSLGMKIVRSLAAQLGGDVRYDRAANCFNIIFKDTAARRMVA